MVTNHFRDIYKQRLKFAHQSPDVKEIHFLNHYSDKKNDYLRGHKCRRKIKCLFGNKFANSDEIEFLGAKIYNPLKLIIDKQFIEHKKNCIVCPIHGDLHANNVIIDNNKNTRLIDFAWAKQEGHFLIDFVLMENSIRFLLFPKYLNLKDQLIIDEKLMSEDVNDALNYVETEIKSHLKPYYLRLLKSIQVIRQCARDVTKKNRKKNVYDFNEYLIAQFLVLYGLLKYDDYNINCAVRKLGLLALHIKKKVL